MKGQIRYLAAALAVFFALAAGWAQDWPQRQFFQVATGSTAGSYFPAGELIAGIVSHPPGLARCDTAWVCGPAGVIVSARTSEGAVANVLAVNAGETDSGLAQADIVADAVAGSGEFRAAGRQKHIRVIASLFPETVHLVVAADSRIDKVSDLRGKRVSIGTDGSGVGVVAHAVLAAYGLSEHSIRASKEPYDVSADLLESKRLDAFFFLGSAPAPLIGDLFAHDAARLVPIDGDARRNLLRRMPSLTADSIPQGSYPGTGTIQTVSARTLWVVKDSASPDVVEGLLRALFNPANRDLLDAEGAAGRHIRLDDATLGLTAPLHPGAERFYRQMGKLPGRS
jgi:uncharacterized protein